MNVSKRISLIRELEDKEFRDAWVADHIRVGLAFQIRAIRKHRNWTQEELAQYSQTTQTVISRLEDPNYGKLSLSTLLKLATAFDVGLLVRFKPFRRLIDELNELSFEALSVESFSDEVPKLKEQAADKYVTDLSTTDTSNDNVVLFPRPIELSDYRVHETKPGSPSVSQTENVIKGHFGTEQGGDESWQKSRKPEKTKILLIK